MVDSKSKSIVVLIYTHPELYPPLLNAIDELSDIFDHVTVVSRNLKPKEWQYPANVEFFTTGKLIPVRESETRSNWWKINSFLKFAHHLFNTLKREKPEWVMCNDPISLLAVRLIRPFITQRVRLWYQNHDVAELKGVRKFSIGYFAIRSEKESFKKIDLFTLPSKSRAQYFPLEGWSGAYFVVPNYPSKRRMQVPSMPEFEDGGVLKLIYQGRISDEHGLEEIIRYLPTDGSLTLTLVGPGSKDYKKTLEGIIKELSIHDRVFLLEPVPYASLVKITQAHHVGLAINKPVNIIYSTGAQSSNKIYEYAAAALPILYYDDMHYREYLGKYSWAFKTDLSNNNLRTIFNDIKINYSGLSGDAKSAFENSLNFGNAFMPVFLFLKNSTKD